MTAVYTPDTSGVNTSTLPAALSEPRPLPPHLRAYLRVFVSLAKNEGFAYADPSWFMEKWGVKRWKFYAIVEKLELAGALIVEKLKDSHKRIYWPVALPKRYKAPGNASVAAPAPDSAASRSWSEETAEKQEAVRLLVAQGVNAFRARRLAEGRSLDEVKSSITAWSQWCQKADVKQPLRALEKAVREFWPPQDDADPAPAPIHIPAEPAPAPSAIQNLENLPERLRDGFLRLSQRPPDPAPEGSLKT